MAVPKKPARLDLAGALQLMGDEYRADPSKAVRSQGFIQHLHRYLAEDLDSRLTTWAKKSRGVYVKREAKLLGVAKDKSVDVAVIDPQNGPLLIVGVRSQMSSIGKNVPGYFEGVIGDAMALEERFPMSTHGYVYLHPLTVIKAGKEAERLNHARYCRMYGVDHRQEWDGLPVSPWSFRPVRLHGCRFHRRTGRTARRHRDLDRPGPRFVGDHIRGSNG